jgi:HAD superfamily hydrolase (TIGR01549 family)
MPGALAALQSFTDAGVLLGLASNAQHYTRDELALAGFSLDQFHPALSFLSGDHGFAKPSPRVFQFLTERLAALGISPSETLMIGDSIENDIFPARAAGWQTRLISGTEENPWRDEEGGD